MQPTMYDVVLRSAVASFHKSISVELSGRCDCVWVGGGLFRLLLLQWHPEAVTFMKTDKLTVKIPLSSFHHAARVPPEPSLPLSGEFFNLDE